MDHANFVASYMYDDDDEGKRSRSTMHIFLLAQKKKQKTPSLFVYALTFSLCSVATPVRQRLLLWRYTWRALAVVVWIGPRPCPLLTFLCI